MRREHYLTDDNDQEGSENEDDSEENKNDDDRGEDNNNESEENNSNEDGLGNELPEDYEYEGSSEDNDDKEDDISKEKKPSASLVFVALASTSVYAAGATTAAPSSYEEYDSMEVQTIQQHILHIASKEQSKLAPPGIGSANMALKIQFILLVALASTRVHAADATTAAPSSYEEYYSSEYYDDGSTDNPTYTYTSSDGSTDENSSEGSTDDPAYTYTSTDESTNTSTDAPAADDSTENPVGESTADYSSDYDSSTDSSADNSADSSTEAVEASSTAKDDLH
ncbi:dentin sialophosphoprotein-like [Bactrocera tryoni]|uniref:dentin sialophosphoprotein-like n=1 Tax=Bactrocera tryoni TaxID=59916 RepID=UPI001A99B2A9|nr:dentin sialophosphoprotein-like [Bactrocera tryoni]